MYFAEPDEEAYASAAENANTERLRQKTRKKLISFEDL